MEEKKSLKIVSGLSRILQFIAGLFLPVFGNHRYEDVSYI